MIENRFVLSRISLSELAWANFVDSQAAASAFHHPAWAGLLAECYGYHAFALALIDDSGHIVAGLPVMEVRGPLGGRRWISLPFTDNCSPLAGDETNTATLIEALIAQRRQHDMSTLEVRSALPPRSGVYPNMRYVLHTLVLDADPGIVFERFAKKFRQYPRKAERDGLHEVSSGNYCDVDTFYSIHLKTRVKLGVPIQPKRFFDLLWKRIISQRQGKIIIVANGNGKPISGAVLLHHQKNVMIKYSASDPAYLDARCHYFTFWKCIEWACLNGMTVIDFGKTDISDEGLRKFKNGWGSHEEPLVYSIIADRPPKPMSGRLSRGMSAVIRRSPPVVCRFLGELFYKYAA